MSSDKFQGLRIVITDTAMRELIKYGKTLYDVVSILEHGYDAPRKRKLGFIEKWRDKGNRTCNVVVKRDYNYMLKEDCWILIHFGRFTRR